MKTWRGQARLLHAMVTPLKAKVLNTGETFEQFFERFEVDRKQKWKDQHSNWLALPLATRMEIVIRFQIWHKKTFGFWHPDNVIRIIHPKFQGPDEIIKYD